MPEEVMVKIRKDANFFYIQYGSGAQWEKIRIADLPWSVEAILNTYMDDKYNLVIETE